MISCLPYSDTWQPFIKLLDHFWPDHPGVTLVTDYLDAEVGDICPEVRGYSDIFAAGARLWCGVLDAFTAECKEPIMLLQDDFFLSAPVNEYLIDHAIEQMKARKAGMVRLYPCPGADEDYGDPYFGTVKRGGRYRISCQASIWRPDYLRKIASQFNTPQEFELEGTPFSCTLPEDVLAFKRDVQPWPLSYICTSIVRGEWLPEAKELCDREGITGVDWTRRPFRAA